MPEGMQQQIQEVAASQPTSKSKLDFLSKIGFFIFWLVVAIVLIILLDSFSHGFDQLRFTPRKGFSLDFSYQLEILRAFGVWIIGIIVVGSLITYFVSKSVVISKIFLILVLILTVGFSALAYYVSRQPCEGLGCIGIGFSLWFAEATWFIAAGSLPILYISSIKGTNLVKNKRFWLSGLVVLLGISILWFFTTSYLRAESSKKVSTAKSEVQQVYSDPNFPVFDPTYLPSAVGDVGHEWVADRENSTEYIRNYSYSYGKTRALAFNLIETKPKVPKSDEAYFQEDLTKLNEKQKKFTDSDSFAYNAEGLIVAGYPAIFYYQYGKYPSLYLYREGVRIEISVNPGSDQQLSKEELIRIAESLKKVN